MLCESLPYGHGDGQALVEVMVVVVAGRWYVVSRLRRRCLVTD